MHLLHRLSPVCLCLLGLLLSNWATAWPAAVDWAADNTGSGDANRNAITVGDDDIPRCNVAVKDDQGVITEDPLCHRYGLIWQPAFSPDDANVMQQQIDWNPRLTDSIDVAFRLPTIKELIRLFDYDNSDGTSGITDRLIQYWLENKCTSTVNNGNCLQQNVTLTDESTELKDSYLISSTYLNIDGNDNERTINGSNLGPFGQVLAIRMRDGKVVMMEPGSKGRVFNGNPNQGAMLALCLGLITKNTQNNELGDDIITGGCDYRVNGNDGDDALPNAANLATVPVFALLVKEIK